MIWARAGCTRWRSLPARWGSGESSGGGGGGGGRSWAEEERVEEEEEDDDGDEEGRGEPVLLLLAESPCVLSSQVGAELEVPERQGAV